MKNTIVLITNANGGNFGHEKSTHPVLAWFVGDCEVGMKTWGEALLGKEEHKIQMKRVKQWEKEMKYCRNCRFEYSRFGMEKCEDVALNNIKHVNYLAISSAKQIRKLANKNNDCRAYKRKWWKVWAR